MGTAQPDERDRPLYSGPPEGSRRTSWRGSHTRIQTSLLEDAPTAARRLQDPHPWKRHGRSHEPSEDWGCSDSVTRRQLYGKILEDRGKVKKLPRPLMEILVVDLRAGVVRAPSSRSGKDPCTGPRGNLRSWGDPQRGNAQLQRGGPTCEERQMRLRIEVPRKETDQRVADRSLKVWRRSGTSRSRCCRCGNHQG